MGRGSTIWQAFGLGIALFGFAMAVGACGGDDGSESADESAKAAVQVSSPNDEKQAIDSPAQDAPDAKAVHKDKSNSNASTGVAVAPQATEATGRESASPTPNNSGGESGRVKVKPPAKIKPGGKGGPPQGAKPPPWLPGGDGDPYEVAKRLCGDQALVDTVPPEYRGDAEHMATLYAEIFDPANKQAAYEGCLVGLQSLGL